MARTVVGLFDEMVEAENTVKELEAAGFSTSDISLVAHRAKCGPAVGPVESVSEGGGIAKLSAVGGLAGFATAMVALAIPGIGPLLAAGPIAAELVAGGVGAAAGAVLGGLRQSGVPEEDAGCYCEALKRGGILLSVSTSDERAEEAERIIGQHRLIDIEDCAEQWRQSGWKGFDPNAEPVAASQPAMALPFDPKSIMPSVRRAEKERRAVRSYVRIS